MEQVTANLISILFLGTAYAMILYIISVGLSVTMGLMNFQNLAHGVFAMAGGYVFVRSTASLGMPFALALILSFVVVALASVAFERLLYAPLYRAGELEQVMFSIGLAFMAIAAAKYLYGPLSQRVSLPDSLRGQIDLGFRSFPAYRLFLIAMGFAILAALWLGLERTRLGAQIRAAVDNRRMAESLGINTQRLFMLTFALGSGLAGLGGALGADILAIHPGYPLQHLVYFLIVVSVGGLGSIHGPFIAALLLGIGDTACTILAPEIGAFFVYAAVLLILLVRPHGLFGRA
jgi:branched-chain amino acid transport system permease protein